MAWRIDEEEAMSMKVSRIDWNAREEFESGPASWTSLYAIGLNLNKREMSWANNYRCQTCRLSLTAKSSQAHFLRRWCGFTDAGSVYEAFAGREAGACICLSIAL